MRTHGHLSKWNEDRGFGFIALGQGGEEIFVHVSAYPRSGDRPTIGELVSFEIQVAADGKKRAIKVQRPGQAARRSGPKHDAEGRNGFRSLMQIVAVIAIIVAIGGYAWRQVGPSESDAGAGLLQPETRTEPVAAHSVFQCDGRTQCSQMTSCAEAEYFLKHCPNTQLDGNNDGEPCEQQWCN